MVVDGELVQVGILEGDDGRYVVALNKRVIVVAADLRGAAMTIHGPFGRHAMHVVPFLKLDASSQSLDGKLVAPMMGTILKLCAQVGDKVQKSDVLVIEESMKMEMSLAAPIDGVVTAVRCRDGEVVERNQILIELEPLKGESS
jgi:3-methylcrotonyl-CoA carboxylase alpha subunit